MEKIVPLPTSTGTRKFLVIGLFLVIISAFLSFAVAQSSHFGKSTVSEYHIELREDGFYPKDLQVLVGSTVRFITKKNQQFWPASDPHPIHNILSAFDSKQPINADGSWAFTFHTEGTFKYHDHLFPLSGGTIVVGKNNNISSVTDKESCAKLTNEGQQKTCWQFLLENTLKKSGLEESFALFRELAQLQPSECHQYAHDLGEYVFNAHSQGNKIQIGEEASYCGYGFWHGFMAKMMKDSNFEQARRFCDSMSSPTKELTLSIRNNCAHGIGIGLVPDPPPPELWGKAQSIIEPALKYCDTIQGGGYMVDNCHSGVFHPIVDFMHRKQYAFRFDPDNPLALCFAQEEKYRFQCHLQVAPKLADLSNRDLPGVFRLLKQIPDTFEFQYTFMLAVMNFVNQQMSNEDYLDFLEECQNLNPAVSNLCIAGIIRSLFATGIPGKEYLRGIELCSSENFDDRDRTGCFEDVVKVSRINYPEEKVRSVCSTIEKAYRNICN